jgi:hypothetical protein
MVVFSSSFMLCAPFLHIPCIHRLDFSENGKIIYFEPTIPVLYMLNGAGILETTG